MSNHHLTVNSMTGKSLAERWSSGTLGQAPDTAARVEMRGTGEANPGRRDNSLGLAVWLRREGRPTNTPQEEGLVSGCMWSRGEAGGHSQFPRADLAHLPVTCHW